MCICGREPCICGNPIIADYDEITGCCRHCGYSRDKYYCYGRDNCSDSGSCSSRGSHQSSHHGSHYGSDSDSDHGRDRVKNCSYVYL